MKCTAETLLDFDLPGNRAQATPTKQLAQRMIEGRIFGFINSAKYAYVREEAAEMLEAELDIHELVISLICIVE